MSRSILSRRKTGKSALLQRLYNLVFQRNDGLIPFYFEVGEGKKWIGDFCTDFFLTFIMQYTAFKTRNPAYARVGRTDFATALDIVRKEKLEYLAPYIEHVVRLLEQEHLGRLWDSVREIPYQLASIRDESIVQIVDEFQYLNSEICRDSGKFSLAEAERFLEKTRLLLEAETVGRYVGFVYSVSGFAKDALEFMEEKKIAWSDDDSWLEG